MTSLAHPSSEQQQQQQQQQQRRESLSASKSEQWHDSGVGSDDEEHSTPEEMAEKERLYRPNDDVEAQHQTPLPTTASPTVDAEYETSTKVKLIYLGVYFFFNLALTIYNKAVLGKFAFPWLLTALHAGSASLGCYALLMRGYFRLTTLTTHENMVLVAFSFLFTINIAMSNVSLAMVSVPFHQIMRSTVPLFTIIIFRVAYSRTYSMSTYLSMVPLILGVGLATYGDYYFTNIGFILTLAGVVLAAIKTVVTNRLMTGSLALPALEILLRMSPLAAIQSVVFSAVTGELSAFLQYSAQGNFTRATFWALMGNGLLAFLLNVTSFQTNKLAGALTISVCGNIKQCLTIMLGIVLFDVKVGPVNGAGMLVALAGAAWYSKVELGNKMKKAASSQAQQQAKQESEQATEKKNDG